MQCRQCDDFDSRWDRFVLANQQGTFFHLLGWRDVIARNFGYRPFYFYAEEQNEIQGVLPLFLVRSLLFGKALVTIPLGVYGGIVSQSDEAEKSLFRAVEELARKLQVRYFELRGNPYKNGNGLVDGNNEEHRLIRRDLYVTFIREINEKEEENFALIPRKQRRMIRQAQKRGLRSRMDDDRLRECYQVYAQSVRNLGTPVFSYGYFRDLKQTFGDQCRTLLVEYQGKTVAGVLTFFYKDQILPYYSGSLFDSRHLAPNDFMYWELMSYGSANGHKAFDFGRSKKDSGSFNFKRHWGFEPLPLPYFYYRVNGKSLPDASSRNPKLQWAMKLWSRLPLSVTTALGPRIVPHLLP